MQILTFTNLYPSVVLPRHGIFVEHRLRQLVGTGVVKTRVVAPLPWVPFRSKIFGQFAAFSGVPAHEERHGIDVYRTKFYAVPRVTSWLNPYAMALGALPTVRRLQRQQNFDVIDAHFVYPDGAAAVLLGKWLGKPVVVSARGTDIHTFPQYRVPRAWIKWVLRRADALVSVSRALGEDLSALGAPESKISVLRNGVDLRLFTPHDRTKLREELRLRGPLLLSVGHLVPDKGHHFVVEALAALPEMQLVIVGEGSQRDELRALAAKHCLTDRVTFTGNVPQPLLAKYYAAADITVLASRAEGMPNVLLESMACGTPVVATNVGGASEVVDAEIAGRLLAHRTPAEIVEAVRELMRSPRASSDVRRHAERFSWGSTTEGLISLFERVRAGSSDTSVRAGRTSQFPS